MMVQSIQTNISNSDSLFDETSGYDDETGVRFSKGLTETERKEATLFYHLFNELMGVCIIVGDPGTGKDTFGNYISYYLKRYFDWKRILRDEKPRRLFGNYAGLFNEDVLVEDLTRMRALSEGVKESVADKILDKSADDWVSNKGQVLLKNSVLYLTEFWRYCNRREAMNPMNRTMGGIHREKRHLDVLILGTVQLVEDLDRKTCMPFIDWKVTCTRATANKTGFVYFLHKVKYDKRIDMLVPLGRSFPIPVDAGKPRPEMGDGKIRLIKPYYKPETEEERVVLEVLCAGVDSYEELVNILLLHGDMTEAETLVTVKELKFSKRKRVIDYPCVFGLFNSKSAPNMRTTLKLGG